MNMAAIFDAYNTNDDDFIDLGDVTFDADMETLLEHCD